jgi:mono/diheme cytochrome c family protein
MERRLYFAATLSAACMTVTPAIAAEATDALVAKGAYVETAADCQPCHTAVGGKPFAGGLALGTPFGDLVTPNITPDKATGIGTWTRDDFANALRNGVDDEGAPLYPAMPYVHYTRMTDDDLDALWAYMQTVTPVNNEVKVNELPFPYSVRSSLLAWKAMFFTPGRFEPDPSKSAEYNRGAYLVEALGHCGSCHTPRNLMGASITDQALQGATIQEWYAPDISNGKDSVIHPWTKERLADFLEGHNAKDLMPPFGPMAEVVYDSTSKLKPSDISAIADYLKSRPAPVESAQSAAKTTTAHDELGREVFENQCATCHGAEGEGKAGVAAKLAGSEALLAKRPFNILSVLIEGIEPRGIWGEMPSFASDLSDQEIAAVANYVRTSWGNDGLANVTPGDVAAWRRFASAPSAELERAMTCPNVPASRLDDEVREQLAKLGTGPIDKTAVRKIYKQYSERFPQLSAEDRIIALMATYCRDAAKALPNRTSVIRQQLEFADALVAADVGAKTTEDGSKP